MHPELKPIQDNIHKKITSPSRKRVKQLIDSRDIIISDVVDPWIDWLYFKGLEDTTIKQYAEMWIGWLHNSGLLKYPLSVLDLKTLDGFINSKDGSNIQTRKLRLASMRSYMLFCEAEGYIAKNPSKIMNVRQKNLSHVQKEKRVVIPFTQEEYNHIINRFNNFINGKKCFDFKKRSDACKFWILACSLSYYTGLRFGDICNLELASYTGDRLIVHTGKTNKRVALPLDHELLGGGIVKELLDSVNLVSDEYFFPYQRRLHNNLYRKAQLHVSFKRWMVRFGIKEKTFHSFRHACATRMQEGGSTFEEIGEILGHTATKTTQGYCHG